MVSARNSIDTNGLAQALFEEAGDALFLCEPEGDRLLNVNLMAQRLSGYPRAELLRLPATLKPVSSPFSSMFMW